MKIEVYDRIEHPEKKGFPLIIIFIPPLLIILGYGLVKLVLHL